MTKEEFDESDLDLAVRIIGELEEENEKLKKQLALTIYYISH